MDASTRTDKPTDSASVQLEPPTLAQINQQSPTGNRSRVTIKNYYPYDETENAGESPVDVVSTHPGSSVATNNPYNAGYDQVSMDTRPQHRYDQNRLPAFLLRDVPATRFPAQGPMYSNDFMPDSKQAREQVSDLRLLTAFSMLFNLAFGAAALRQAILARKELKNGNVARAKEHNSNALGLAIAGTAISFFVGAAIAVQHLFIKV